MLGLNWTSGGLCKVPAGDGNSSGEGGSSDVVTSKDSHKSNEVSEGNEDSLCSEINFGDFSDWENSSLQVAPGAIVCVEAEIKGDVKIGTKSVVHPCAKILATAGPIIIGESNIVEELVIIENKSTEPMIIGKNNTFEVGATVYAKNVGDSNVFETKCTVGENVHVTNGCVFGAGTKITQSTSVVENSVFYGEPLKHRIAGERPAVQVLQIDFLSRILPNYHHVKKAQQP